MFEHMLAKKDVLFQNATYIFYMEPDVWPIQDNWLEALQNEIGFNYFWIRGSSYRGSIYDNDVYAANSSQRIDPNITTYDICKYFHINGNAIYNLGDNKLAKIYFEEMSPLFARMFRKKRAEWYDNVACYYLYEMKGKFSTRIIHYFVFSDFIQNQNMAIKSLTEVVRHYPRTYFIHKMNLSDY